MFNLTLRNPFSSTFNCIYSKSRRLGRQYADELSVYRSDVIIHIGLEYRNSNYDHRGFKISFGLLGFECDYNLYDTRHSENY